MASPALSIKTQQTPSPTASSKRADELGKQQERQETTDHPATPSLLQKVLAELVATFVLVFAGCGSVLVNESSGGQLGLVGVASTWGVVVMAMVYATSHISGAHINPAVTLASAICNDFPWREVPWYIAAQSLASIVAAFTLKLVLHAGPLLQQATTRPLKEDYLQSFVLEVIITFILLFVVSGVGPNTHSVGNMAGLVIGATVAMNVLIAGPVSGASMNPARSLGPAVAANSYKELYVYILAPSVGAILGCLVYNNICLKKTREIAHQDKPFNIFRLMKSFSNMLKK